MGSSLSRFLICKSAGTDNVGKTPCLSCEDVRKDGAVGELDTEKPLLEDLSLTASLQIPYSFSLILVLVSKCWFFV
jgi:hypothetical protein